MDHVHYYSLLVLGFVRNFHVISRDMSVSSVHQACERNNVWLWIVE
jgi:hypothetical protein